MKATSRSVNRREFLKTGILASGGLLLSFSIPARGLQASASAQPGAATINAFLQIGTDNTILITISKVEMGQGIWTTLPMLIAEELDCDWKAIKVQHRGSGKGDDFKEHLFVQSTGGSDTTRSEFDRYRTAGATARTMLVTAAAQAMHVPAETCRTENSFVISGNQRISYGEVATAASKLPVPTVKLREPNQWKYIGKSQPQLNIADKVNGKTQYGIDIHFPGLLTAMVAHPPVFGATVRSFDATKAKAITGVHHVVQIPTGVAVIGDHFWAAKSGRDALIIDWDLGPNASFSVPALLEDYKKKSREKGTMVQQKGDINTALQKATHVIEAEYTFPFLAHAPMEPENCTVKITPGGCEIWTGTQSPFLHQQEAAAFLGLKPDQVIFHTPHMGGSFGRRGTLKDDYMLEALQIAKTTNKPIKLVWSREDDIQGGQYRPVYLHRVRIGTDGQGLPQAWEHHVVGQSIFTGTVLENDIAPNGLDYSSVDGVNGSPYIKDLPDHHIELHTTVAGIPITSLRSVGNTHTAFVMETLIDELALKAKKDPVEYRRALLKDQPRHLAALNLAAEKAEWTKPLPAGHHRGIAVHRAMDSAVAQAVEISIDQGKLRVHRVVCAIDCGLAVNPDGVRAQIEGGIIYGLTAALYGQITMENGKVQQQNFHNYRMVRIGEAPAIEVHIVNSTARMSGAGEPGVAPIGPAVANAILAATGKPLRSLPIRKEDLVRA
jgi:isoquinoline 1-oxidoreductase subunit beta